MNIAMWIVWKKMGSFKNNVSYTILNYSNFEEHSKPFGIKSDNLTMLPALRLQL